MFRIRFSGAYLQWLDPKAADYELCANARSRLSQAAMGSGWRRRARAGLLSMSLSALRSLSLAEAVRFNRAVRRVLQFLRIQKKTGNRKDGGKLDAKCRQEGKAISSEEF